MVTFSKRGIFFRFCLTKAEMLCLTLADIDLENKVIHITKSYQRIKGKDVVTEPKTPKSKRDVVIPDFLCEELEDYMDRLYGITTRDRMFPITKHYMHHEMDRGSKKAGVKRIRIHDLRHSHVSHLIDLGFSAVAIADRVGHESIDITYRYSHLFPSKQLAMADRLDEVNASYENDGEFAEDISVENEVGTNVTSTEKDENDRKILDIEKYLAG